MYCKIDKSLSIAIIVHGSLALEFSHDHGDDLTHFVWVTYCLSLYVVVIIVPLGGICTLVVVTTVEVLLAPWSVAVVLVATVLATITALIVATFPAAGVTPIAGSSGTTLISPVVTSVDGLVLAPPRLRLGGLEGEVHPVVGLLWAWRVVVYNNAIPILLCLCWCILGTLVIGSVRGTIVVPVSSWRRNGYCDARQIPDDFIISDYIYIYIYIYIYTYIYI